MFGADAFVEADEFQAGDEQDEIQQEDAWAVIHSFFEEKGLVRQQLDSFDEFVTNTIQEIVDETPEITVRPENQHAPGQEEEDLDNSVEYRVKFGQIFLSKPVNTEVDGETVNLFPREARLRNMT